jgi:phage repressor protein C with HTH and peptisase S24 domain
MWEISPSQCNAPGKFRQCPIIPVAWDTSRMTDGIDIQRIRATIINEMERQDVSKRGLSTRAGIGVTAVRDLLERTTNPGISTLGKVAEALRMPLETLLGRDQVPLVGQIGAGGLVSYSSEDDGYEMVSRPPNAIGDILALEVLGDSMLPKYEAGDVIYINQQHTDPAEKHVGEYCAIRLPEGGTYLKMLAPGRDARRFTLRSLNAGDIENVEVEWATPVLFIMPRRSR